MIAEIGARAIITMAVIVDPVLKSGSLDPALLETANTWFGRSWWGLMISGAVTALAACFTVAFLIVQFWSSNVKERFSDERISANEAETARAVADSDAAKEGTAKASERIAELSLLGDQLRKDTADANLRARQSEEREMKFKMSRALFVSGSGCKEALRGKPAGKVEILWQRGVGDGQFLSMRLAGCLRGDDALPWWNILRVGAIDDLPREASSTGITVIGRSGGGFMFGKPSDTLLDIVGSALRAGIDRESADIHFGTDASMPDDAVRIVIGPKL